MKNSLLLILLALLCFACTKRKNTKSDNASATINATQYHFYVQAKHNSSNPNKIDLTLSLGTNDNSWVIDLYRIDPNMSEQEVYATKIDTGLGIYSRLYNNVDSCMADMYISNGDAGIDDYIVKDSAGYNILNIESFNNGVLKGSFNVTLFRQDRIYLPAKGLADTLYITNGTFEVVVK